MLTQTHCSCADMQRTTRTGFIPSLSISKMRVSRKRPRATCCTASNASHSDNNMDFASRVGPPPVPDSIKQLDMLEFHRRQAAEPMPSLPPEVLQAIRERYPRIKKLDQVMEREMSRDDYDINDHRVCSWAYEYLRPWAMGRPLQALIACSTAYSTVKLVQYVKSRVSQTVLMSALVSVDTFFTVALGAVFPAFLLSWALHRARFNDVRTDGVRRSVFMFCLTALTLPGVWAMAATTNVSLAMVSSVFVRCMLFVPIWGWLDLRREATLGELPLAKLFKVWRVLATVAVLFYGSILRLLTMFVPQDFPAHFFARRADLLRRALWKTFPVSCSLCNDPRGLFLLGSLVVAGLAIYALYLIVFVTDCCRIRCHRECESVLTSFCVGKGIYQPNRHPDEIRSSLSAPDPDETFLPSRPMMLRPDEDQLATNSGVMADKVLPVFAYLDREKEIMKQTGVTEWMKYRSEQIPAHTEEEKEERDRKALLSWAKALQPEDEKLSIEDYFQTVEDDEYFYDPTTGNWLFVEGPEGQKGDKDKGNENTQNGIDLQAEDELEIPPEWEPIVQRMLDRNNGEGEDESADSRDDEDAGSASASVYRQQMRFRCIARPPNQPNVLAIEHVIIGT